MITEHICQTDRHTTFYLEAGPKDGVPIVFVHGWPELSLSWRNQLATFGALGFRAIAPDTRGFGRSSLYDRIEDYATEETVRDLIDLVHALGYDKAIWVGHDSGASTLWSLASHHPEACIAVANLCVPYVPGGVTLDNVLALVDRRLYPAQEHPFGQWAYWAYHNSDPDDVAEVLQDNVEAFVKMVFRRAKPEGFGQVGKGALIRRPSGWAPAVETARTLDLDTSIISEQEYWQFVAAMKNSTFRRINMYYRNNERNAVYGRSAVNGDRLDMPVLFVHAVYDDTCDTLITDFAAPMREYCRNLTEAVVPAGHWIQQERPADVNAALTRWLVRIGGDAWPKIGEVSDQNWNALTTAG